MGNAVFWSWKTLEFLLLGSWKDLINSLGKLQGSQQF